MNRSVHNVTAELSSRTTGASRIFWMLPRHALRDALKRCGLPIPNMKRTMVQRLDKAFVARGIDVTVEITITHP